MSILESKFGIEFEVCVCDYQLKQKLNKVDFLAYYYRKIQQINSESQLNVTVQSDPQPHRVKHVYDSWFITLDSTIECSTSQKEPLSYGHIAFRPKEHPLEPICYFSSVEIVSPITRYTAHDMVNFFEFYEKVIFHKDFLYETHSSQGMHINISHPSMDNLKFIKLWWYFEPVIITFLPKERRSTGMAYPLRDLFQDYGVLIRNWERVYKSPVSKFYAVSIKPDRIEIRIVDSNLIPLNVEMWVQFLIQLLNYSINNSMLSPLEGTPTFDDLFDNYIRPSHPSDCFEFLKDYFKSLQIKYQV